MTDNKSGDKKAKENTLNNSTPLGLRADVVGIRPGTETLIVHEGKTGVFTPLEVPGAEEPVSTEKLVIALRREVALLNEENQKLKLKIKEMTNLQSRTPDDFASAVSNSIDSLQSRLGQMKNPMSNFAVREMTIEAQVQVGVTALGTIDYYFVPPGESVPAHQLSKISLTMSPVPKAADAQSLHAADFTPMHDVADIQGIGETYRTKLQQKNIYTVSDLLSAGSRARARVELEKSMGVDRERMAEWLSHAELLTVKDINGRNAEILIEMGIKGLSSLAEGDAASLVEKYNAKVASRAQATHKPITEAQAALWIKAAKLYTGKKTQNHSTSENNK